MKAENLIQFPTHSLATIEITKEIHLFKSLAVPPKVASSVSRQLYVQALNVISGPEQRMITFLLNQIEATSVYHVWLVASDSVSILRCYLSF